MDPQNQSQYIQHLIANDVRSDNPVEQSAIDLLKGLVKQGQVLEEKIRQELAEMELLKGEVRATSKILIAAEITRQKENEKVAVG